MKFLKISDFADVVGVSTVTLRNWERQGLLLPHHKSPIYNPNMHIFYKIEQDITSYKIASILITENKSSEQKQTRLQI